MTRGQERRPGSSRALRRNPEQTAVCRPTIRQQEDSEWNLNHLMALSKRCLDNMGEFMPGLARGVQALSSREDREKERSRLDSMVLLIMKLDQLDQEIESALSSAPSNSGTPTLKRRIISVSNASKQISQQSVYLVFA
ncbi:hypothetical protein AOLI_G00199100 [Acnodon oligacanthus]